MGKHVDEFRAGAESCAAVLARLDDILMFEHSGQDTAEYFAFRDAAISELMGAAGDTPPRMRGALAVLAELVVVQAQTRASYDLQTWRPEAVMSPEECAAARQRIFDDVAADEQRSNVVQFRRA